MAQENQHLVQRRRSDLGQSEAEVHLGSALLHVGKLRFSFERTRQHSEFSYNQGWVENASGFALAPDLPLGLAAFFTSSGRSSDQRESLPGVFQDAAPDSWGRLLLERLHGAGLSEFDMLTLTDDTTRQGAIRFCDGQGRIITGDVAPVPRLIDLEELRGIAASIERRGEVSNEALRLMAGAGGSIGGARPKANVLDDGQLWIAKFSSANDGSPVERIEVATLGLAREVGLNAPEARLMLERTPSPIALIRRFDRAGAARIPYISARTALERHGTEQGAYTEIAQFIQQHSDNPRADLHELWSRIVFTILVTNTDDHLKNHGFVYAGEGQWSLSQLFDVNPQPERHRFLKTAIMEGAPFEASLNLALGAAAFFSLTVVEARQRASEMARQINGVWKDRMRGHGVTGTELRALEPAFEHAEMEQALAL
ncbi:MAG: type II toxin-antitoxin system HipA family toxin [Cypionkella sp.]|uniref:type II toxin-antitoxin system HipA family toxin n=1 Tax=Cypionkella sp. TaxID=2811411 RepID=UPI00273130FC|nr:type II toxin-antitoxin system HipA family toxin [Cypionkella sp.]MDP1576215.1 type II toxin-antitoxin system HipA family toxin [Cypionkella sp.]MDP2049077.1 type II toxin-antitoxin system HipA family toxin [Cypionkella sp.]